MPARLGFADVYKAFAHRNVLFLTAKGKNISTGWRNWFEPARGLGNNFDFMQQPPSGPAGAIVLPFFVVNAFPLPNDQDVLIREDKDGTVETKTIRIERGLCPVEEATFEALIPPHALDLLAHYAGRGGGTSIRKHLGAFDIPFGCASWRHPTRAKRIDVYLEVDVAGTQDVEGAVESCLREAAIVTALAVLLTPIGWASGPSAFEGVLTACLVHKLQNILKVKIESEAHCD